MTCEEAMARWSGRLSIFDESPSEQAECVRQLVLSQDFHHVTENHLGQHKLLCFYRTCASSPTRFRIVAFVMDTLENRRVLGSVEVLQPGWLVKMNSKRATD